jgi:hypothetical protein
MLKKLWLFTCIIITHFVFNNTEAMELKSEFYKAEDIPKEFEENKQGGDLTVISVEKFPANHSIVVLEKRLLSSKEKSSGPLQQHGKPFVYLVYSQDYAPGEPVTITFKDSEDSKESKVIEIFPNPLRATASDGATMEAQLFSNDNYNILFTGFNNETLKFKSRSCDENLSHKIPIKRNLMIMYAPAVINKKGGIAKISLIRSSGKNLNLELPWGSEIKKYLSVTTRN